MFCVDRGVKVFIICFVVVQRYPMILLGLFKVAVGVSLDALVILKKVNVCTELFTGILFTDY